MIEPLSTKVLYLEAQKLLSEGGYAIKEGTEDDATLNALWLLAEDIYGVALVACYATWAELLHSWPDAQGALVQTLSRRLNQGNPKAWEGYLVLLTSDKSNDERMVRDIRHDTGRVRKLVGTGESIRYLDDVQAVLNALLPFESTSLRLNADNAPLIDRLPALLEGHGIDQRCVIAAVDAYKSDEPILEAISKALS